MVSSNRIQDKNRLAVTHGARSFLATGRLPAGCSYVAKFLGRLRRELEKAIEAEHGELSFYHSALVSTALRHEARALLLQRWLRKRADTMTPEQLLSFQRDIGNASDARDRALKGMGLDRHSKPDVWATIYQTTVYAQAKAGPTPPTEIEDLAGK